MTRQEPNLTALLDQAYKIKEEMVSSLHATQGSLLMEASARKLLENHIQTITHIVKQLSKDVQVLETQLVQRDSLASGTVFAVQSLDHKNLTGIGDLRGRVARCDASIAKLSGDVRAGGEEILKLQQKVNQMRSGIELKLKDMENKISRSLDKLEVSQSEQITSQKTTTGGLQRDIQQLETKSCNRGSSTVGGLCRMSSGLRELEEETDRLRRWTEDLMNKAVQTHTQDNQQLCTLLQDKVVELEGKLKAQVDLLSSHLERVKMQVVKERSGEQLKRIESKLNTRMETLGKSFREELEQMRREYQSGFQSVHDAIASLRHIGETQAKLDKGELKKDIRQIRRKIVGLQDT